MNIYFLNESFVSERELNISLLDRGFLFGEGIFTTMRLHEGFIENISRHLLRFEENCKEIGILPPKVERKTFLELAARNRADSGTWRLKMIATKGGSENVTGSLALTLEKYKPVQGGPFRLALFPTPVCKPTAHLKALAFLDRQVIKEYAESQGCQEAVTTGVDGCLLECAFSNLLWIKGNTLFTPSFSLPLLKGTYLSSVIDGAAKNGFQIIEAKCRFDEISRDAKVFICNSMIGLRAVTGIEDCEYDRDLSLEASVQEWTRAMIASDLLDVRSFVNSLEIVRCESGLSGKRER